MKKIGGLLWRAVLSTTLAVVAAWSAPSIARGEIRLMPMGSYRGGGFAEGAAEVCAYDAGSRQLYVTNGVQSTLDLVDMAEPARPRLVRRLTLKSYGSEVTSVAVHHGVVAVAVVGADPQGPGRVVLLNGQGQLLATATVGAMPDMVCFTPDGRTVLTANEGEPNDAYTRDPEGSVSLIDLSQGARNVSQSDVTTLDFRAFGDRHRLDPSIRIFGPRATVAQDLEPEYIAVSPDSKTAWVTLQENNALAIVDLRAKQVTRLVGLGFKDHSREGAGLDASNKDRRIRIRPWPVRGMYQPDAIVAFKAGGATYLITANEGDTRHYGGFSERQRVKDVELDRRAFPHASILQENENLGRLEITTADGDLDGDGDYDAIYAYGARSFSIWSAEGKLVYDSGDKLEQITARLLPRDFNCDNAENDSFDDRSDDKGPEPEGVAVGVVGERTYAFIGLERVGGVMVFDVTKPAQPTFETYVNTRNFRGDPRRGTAGDLGPEGLLFIPAEQSPDGSALLVVAYEVSGTTRIYKIVRPPATIQ